MANVDAMVSQAINAIKAGRKPEARNLLEQVVDMDENNEQAWLWLSACMDTSEEQQLCLENVLAINPNNEKAKKGLDALLKGGGKVAPAKSAPRPAAPPPLPVDDPFAGSPFASDDAPATSVDWGRGSIPAYGSGKNVPQPSDDEYDNWMANLPIGTNAPKNPVFDDSAFDASSGPFAAPTSPFGEPASSSPFGSSPSAPASSDPFGGFSNDFDFDAYANPAPSTPASSNPFGGGFDNSSFGSASSGSSPASSPFGQSYDSFGDTASPFESSSPFDSGGFDNSFDSGFSEVEADPFGGSSAFGSSSPFNSQSPADSSRSSKAAADPFGGNFSQSASPQKQSTSFDFGGGSPKKSSPPSTFHNPEDDFAPVADPVFGTDDDDDIFHEGGYDQPSGRGSTSYGGTGTAGASAYRAIPSEIQASASLDLNTLRPVIILGVLNAVVIIGLLINLSSM